MVREGSEKGKQLSVKSWAGRSRVHMPRPLKQSFQTCSEPQGHQGEGQKAKPQAPARNANLDSWGESRWT